MKNSLWTKWGYEDKDLSDIPNAVGGGVIVVLIVADCIIWKTFIM